MKVNVVDKSPDCDIDGISIDRAIEVLDNLRKCYSGSAMIFFTCEYESDTNFNVRHRRLESDEEYAKRVEDTDKMNERQRLQRLAQFEKLKAEFGE